ncbi:MAG: MFS transporter [Legionellales bacterium]|nr:MFS transporter [Legionellales bacterium]
MTLSNTSQSKAPHILYSTFIVGLAALFYLYEFFIRVTPASITHELMRDLNASAPALGIMSGCFFAAYAPMQLPVGMLCDRFGTKKLMTVAILVCGLATLCFSMVHSIVLASLMRFLIGLASAFAFVGPLVLATHWFEARHLATISGIIQTLGCLGAIFAGEPIAQLIQTFNWRTVVGYSGLLGLILTAFFAFYLKDKPDTESITEPERPIQLKDIKALCQQPHTRWISIAAFASWAPMSIFAELWGTSFLMTSYHASQTEATAATAWIWIGVAIASPLAGGWSTRIRSRRIPLITFNAIGLFASCVLIFFHLNGWVMIDTLLFLLGVAAGSQPITFGLACDYNPPKIHGTAMGLNNMAVIAGGVLLQPLVGYLLNLFWDHQLKDGAPIYQLVDYQYALILIPIVYLLGLWATYFHIKETYCESMTSV